MGLAVYFGMAVSEASYYSLIVIFASTFLAVWIVVAKDRWWLPFPVAVALGGFFYIGFRIYLHEIMLACCLLPLILSIAARKESMSTLRQRIPAPVWILTFYILCHWLGCIAINKMNGLGGVGTVSRQYMNAGWPLVIFFAFYLYGNSRHLRTALTCMYLVYVFRFALGLYFYISTPEQSLLIEEQQSLVYIPIINYVPGVNNVTDLRTSTIGLASISLAYCSVSKNRLIKVFHFATALLSIAANLLGGGRAYFAICLILIAFWAMITKKMLPLVMTVFALLFLVGFLNSDPFMIESLPPKVQRTLSGLVFTTDQLSAQKDVGQSDLFHERLRQAGYDRWTESLGSMLVGHGIKPFDEAAWNDKTIDDVTRFSEQAKMTGRYEKGLWTVLATFGAIGFLLYMYLMWFLVFAAAKHLWNHGLHDYEHAFYFLAAFSIVAWLITMPITGDFPSQQILMGLFAKVVFEDAQRRRRLEEANSSEAIGEVPVEAIPLPSRAR